VRAVPDASRRRGGAAATQASVDSDKAEAMFKNGVLTIRLPQRPEAKAKVKKIEVKAA
jgi:HSP20 family molecular chaperone IbpA